MRNRIKKIIFIIIIIVLLLPLIQYQLHFIEEKSLNGSFELAKKDTLNLESWIGGNFQKQYSLYFNDSIGFRNILVRLNNQIKFSLFNQIRTDNAFIGKDKYILDEKYVFANYGLDYIGEEYIKSQTEKLKYIQYKLMSLYNINLLVIMAPSKVSFYENKIPEYFSKFKNDSTNYKTFIAEFKSKGINHIDFKKWFNEIKDTSNFTLFPKYGIHWSIYGSILATDSIIKYIAKDKKLNIPKFKITKITTSDSIASMDRDMANSMNLLFEPKHLKMSYPSYNIEERGDKNLKLLVIGDSYFSSILDSRIFEDISDMTDFYYYNKIHKIINDGEVVSIENYLNNILDFNYIILINTEMNYWNLGNGFIEQMYEELLPIVNEEKENDLFEFYKKCYNMDSTEAIEKSRITVESYKNDFIKYKNARINSRKKYFQNSLILRNELTRKAKERNVSIDEMASIEANWLFNNNLEINKVKQKIIDKNLEINEIVNRIKNNPEWFENVKKQAIDEGVSLNQMLLRSANYVLKKRDE